MEEVPVGDSSLAHQCLALCQTLASQGRTFSLSLTTGSSFIWNPQELPSPLKRSRRSPVLLPFDAIPGGKTSSWDGSLNPLSFQSTSTDIFSKKGRGKTFQMWSLCQSTDWSTTWSHSQNSATRFHNCASSSIWDSESSFQSFSLWSMHSFFLLWDHTETSHWTQPHIKQHTK